MKRIISGLVLAIISTLFIAVPAQAAPVQTVTGVRCLNRSFSDHDDVVAGKWLGDIGQYLGANPQTWYLTATVNYKYCYGKGITPFFKVRNVVGSYNVEGTHMGCNILNPSKRVFVKFYFWDYKGRNFDVQRFTLPCDSDTTASKQIGSTSLGIPLYGSDEWGEPKWKANFHVDIQDRSDGYRTLSGRLYR